MDYILLRISMVAMAAGGKPRLNMIDHQSGGRRRRPPLGSGEIPPCMYKGSGGMGMQVRWDRGMGMGGLGMGGWIGEHN